MTDFMERCEVLSGSSPTHVLQATQAELQFIESRWPDLSALDAQIGPRDDTLSVQVRSRRSS